MSLRLPSFGIGLAGALIASAGLALTPAAAAAQARVALGDDTISIDLARPVSLDRLLHQMGQQAGIDVATRGSLGSVGPVSLHDVTLPEALRRLVGQRSLVLGYDGLASGQPPRLVYALVIGDKGDTVTKREPPPPAASSAPSQALSLRDIVKLSYRRDPAAIVALGDLLARAPEANQRAAAVSALASIGGDEAARLVSSRGLIDPDPKVRAQAVASLWRIQGEGARARLLAIAGLDRDPGVLAALRQRLNPDDNKKS